MPIMPRAEDLNVEPIRQAGLQTGPTDYIGAAVEKAGHTVMALDTRKIQLLGSQNDAIDTARARAAWAGGLATIRQGINPTDMPDTTKWDTSLKDQTTKLRNEVLGGVKNPQTVATLGAEFGSDVAITGANVAESARVLDTSNRKWQALTGLETRNAAAANPAMDPDAAERIHVGVQRDLEALAKSRVITAEEFASLTLDYGHAFAAMKQQQITEKDPGQALFNMTGSAIAGFKLRLDGHEGYSRNKESTAQGNFQITDETWAGLMSKYPNQGFTPDGRKSKDQTSRAMDVLIPEYVTALKGAGLPVTERNLYMIHFMGAGAGPKFLKADPNSPAPQGFEKAARSNPSIFYSNYDASREVNMSQAQITAYRASLNPRTIGQVIGLQGRDFDGRELAVEGYVPVIDMKQLATFTQGARTAYGTQTTTDTQSQQLDDGRAMFEEAKLAYPGDVKQQMAYISNNAHGTVREHALGMAQQDDAFNKTQKNDNDIKLYDGALDLVDKSFAKDATPEAKKAAADAIAKNTNPENRIKLATYLREGPKSVDEPSALTVLNTMTTDQLKGVHINDYEPRLTSSTFQYFKGQIEKLNDPDNGVAKGEAMTDVKAALDSQFKQLEILTGKKADEGDLPFINDMTMMVQKGVENLEAQLKRKPNRSEQLKVINDAFKDFVRPGKGGWFRTDTENLHEVYDEFQTNNMDMDTAADQLRAAKMPVTPENLRGWMMNELNPVIHERR